MSNLYKKILISIIALILILLSSIYLFLVLGLEKVIENNGIQTFIIGVIENKTGYKTVLNNLIFDLTPALNTELKFEKLDISDFLKIKNLELNYGFRKSKRIIKADYIFFDKTKLKTGKNDKKKTSSGFDFNKLPQIEIKKADVILENEGNKKTLINLENISYAKAENPNISFNALIKTNYINHDITVSAKNSLIVEKSALKINNLILNYNKTPLIINGLINKNEYDFTLHSTDLSAGDVEKTFLFFIKQKNNKKNFIENFYDFQGNTDINLHFKNKKIDGLITIKDFSFKSVMFSIPFIFKKAEFLFEDDKISLKEKGQLGHRELYTDFYLTNLFDSSKIIKGSVISSLDNKLIKKYIPEAKVINNVNLGVNYFIQNKIPIVEYSINLPQGSDIYYQKIQLGLADKNRKVYAKTIKKGDDLVLDSYKYSKIENNKESFIVKGDGLFVKKNGKLTLDFIEIETNDFAPISIIGSINKYVHEGYFKGKLKYAGIINQISGTFELKKSRYKDFFVDTASINADSKKMIIRASGTYENEPFNSFIDMVNRFDDNVIINEINLYLKKFTLKRNTNKKQPKKQKNENLARKVKETSWQVKNIRLKLDNLTFKDIVLENIILEGFVEDNFAYFSMPLTKFANGTLEASGIYDFDYNNADIDFSAYNIDSNSASSMVFNLKDQFKGSANAKMHAKIYNKLEYIDANTEFSILDGSLLKLGSSEFIINQSNKTKKPVTVKVKNLINVDLNKMTALKSDIWGNFDVHNSDIENIELYNKHKYLSLFMQGKYNISNQDASLCLWGKYNKNAQKGIRILFIPLSWITKIIFKNENTKDLYSNQINKIPDVDAKIKEQEIILIEADGNINNTKNLHINLKNIN